MGSGVDLVSLTISRISTFYVASRVSFVFAGSFLVAFFFSSMERLGSKDTSNFLVLAERTRIEEGLTSAMTGGSFSLSAGSCLAGSLGCSGLDLRLSRL